MKPVDPSPQTTTLACVNLRHLRTKISRLNLTAAAKEAAALKAQFRTEDEELRRQGRGDEIALRNRRLMGLKDGEKTRLVGFGGVRFE
jgi:hypothetical protein